MGNGKLQATNSPRPLRTFSTRPRCSSLSSRGWAGSEVPIWASPPQSTGGVNLAGRKRPMSMPPGGSLDQKNPVSFLNEIRGTVEYMLLGTWGTGPSTVFTVGCNIDGVPYSGNGPNKKEAKKACAKDILGRLYRI